MTIDRNHSPLWGFQQLTINSFVKINETGYAKPEVVLIDEVPMILSVLLGNKVEIATMTSDSKKEL